MASPSNGCPALRSRSAACRIALITNAVPVLAVGDGVLHGDPGRGLAVTGLLPRLEHLRGRVLGGLLRRDADLAGVVAVQAPVAGVHLAFDCGELIEQVIDAVGLQGGLVVLAAGPERPFP